MTAKWVRVLPWALVGLAVVLLAAATTLSYVTGTRF